MAVLMCIQLIETCVSYHSSQSAQWSLEELQLLFQPVSGSGQWTSASRSCFLLRCLVSTRHWVPTCQCSSLTSLTDRSMVRFLPVTSLDRNITIQFSSNFRFCSSVTCWSVAFTEACCSQFCAPGSLDSVSQPLIGKGCIAAADK